MIKLDWDFVAQVFVEAFSSELDLCLVKGELSTKELNRVHELVETKYSQNDWTGRV